MSGLIIPAGCKVWEVQVLTIRIRARSALTMLGSYGPCLSPVTESSSMRRSKTNTYTYTLVSEVSH